MTRADLHEVRWALVAAAVLVVAGGVVFAVGGSRAMDAVGITVMGSGLVVALAAVFFAIGRSEDRERGDDQPGC